MVSSKMGLFRCRDLLEINTGATVKDLSVFKLNRATESVTRIIELLCRDKNIQIKVDYENAELRNAKFWGDVKKYQQVLINVLSNACKFNPPGSKVEVQISCQALRKKIKHNNES